MSAWPAVRDITCPHCGAAAGDPCTAPRGVRGQPHVARFDRLRSAIRSGREFVVRILHDDPEFRLKSGDLFISIAYPFDGKTSLLHRVSDGFDPECNVYPGHAQFERWATPEETMLTFPVRSRAE